MNNGTTRSFIGDWLERHAGMVMLWPAVLVLLAFAIFPMIVSAYLTMSRLDLVPGGYQLSFVGLRNFNKLLFGTQQDHLLGTMDVISTAEWAILGLVATAMLWGIGRFMLDGTRSIGGLVLGLMGRLLAVALCLSLLYLTLSVINGKGFPGSLVTTLVYVVVGVTAQFLLGLGLAMLAAQPVRGRQFFRVVFFLPLMVTPVGIAYAFRMLADMGKGPFAPLWQLMGLGEFAWAADPWAARIVVLVGETWQWTPFMFLVLLAALEGQPREQIEAAWIDGARPMDVFRHITWPAIAPVAATVILIRLIEAFKIIDLPNVLTNGGPGFATESLTLHSFIAWRTQDLGGSAAVGYMLLFVSTIACTSFVNFVAKRARA